MRIPLILSILITCIPNTAFSIEIDGRYESTVTIENLENGLESAMVNFLEIETSSQNSIYFVYESWSWHTNGHACRLYGTAKKVAHETYEHVQDNEILPKVNSCKARIYTSGNNIILEDVGERCRVDNCGARGQIGESTFPLNSHKKLSTPVVVPW